jgi:hypothetical protein
MHITSEMIARVGCFSVDFHAARMDAAAMLPENPFGVEVRRFGSGVAVKAQHPLLRGKNRIIGFQSNDLELLDDLISFYQADDLRFTLTVPLNRITPTLFRRLVQAGLWSEGSGTVPAIVPDGLPAAPSAVTIRRSGPEEKDLYLDLFQQAFADHEESSPEYRAFQWAEDALPGGVRYVAEMDGKPVGMASFPIVGGVGFCGTAGVVPGVPQAWRADSIDTAAHCGCP